MILLRFYFALCWYFPSLFFLFFAWHSRWLMCLPVFPISLFLSVFSPPFPSPHSRFLHVILVRLTSGWQLLATPRLCHPWRRDTSFRCCSPASRPLGELLSCLVPDPEALSRCRLVWPSQYVFVEWTDDLRCRVLQLTSPRSFRPFSPRTWEAKEAVPRRQGISRRSWRFLAPIGLDGRRLIWEGCYCAASLTNKKLSCCC